MLWAFVMSASAAPDFEVFQPFLESHCYECHDSDVKKGGLDLDELEFDLSDPESARHWLRIFDRVQEGEMPPKKQDRPKKGELAAFLQPLDHALQKVGDETVSRLGRAKLRRLTRPEYENSVRDLLSVGIPLAEYLPEDPITDGFDKVATGQPISRFHLDAYLRAADTALNYATGIALRENFPAPSKCSVADIRRRKGDTNSRGPIEFGGKLASYAVNGPYYGRMSPTEVEESGWYDVKFTDVNGINLPAGKDSFWCSVMSGVCFSHSPTLHWVGGIEVTETPRDYTMQAWIEGGHIIQIQPEESSLKRSRVSENFMGFSKPQENEIPAVLFNSVTVERAFPFGSQDKVRKMLFGDLTVDKGAVVSENPREDLSKLVHRFANRAFRRPISRKEVKPYIEIGRAFISKKRVGETHDLLPAITAAYRAVLCSPRFLFLYEKPGKLDPHAVATRLSYLAWNSVSDWNLRKAANKGELATPEQRAAQLDRLLGNSRGKAFIEGFTDQWLNLREIDFTTPDRRLYRKFDRALKQSMLSETRDYFAYLLEKDLSIGHLVDSDFAMLDTRLARHYKLPEPAVGKGIQKVELPKRSVRGGIVTQASVLKVSADGTNTSPIIRGLWINERILGVHVPPPPPNVGAVEPDIRGATTIRDRIEKHRASDACITCHQKIDPAGNVLENFDPIGDWRKNYGKRGRGPAVNPADVLPDGRAFANIKEWKALIGEDSRDLARAFLGQLTTYATGAPISYRDRVLVEEILDACEPGGYGLRSLLYGLVESPLFLEK